MATERSRMPVGMRSHPSVALSADAAIPAVQISDRHGFAGTGYCEPHPDFLAQVAIWRDQRAGLISLAEAQRQSASVRGDPKAVMARRGSSGAKSSQPRHSRPAPSYSRQYAAEMATTAARDDRLTPQAKAFLQVLRARCGKGRVTEFAKATLAAVMSRSVRTIRRYLFDLE